MYSWLVLAFFSRKAINRQRFLAVALVFLTLTIAFCQLGQAPMQNDGLVDRAIQGIKDSQCW